MSPALQSAEPLPEDSLLAHHAAAQVRQAVDALPEELRTVVLLATFSGLSYAQIAEITKVPEGTVGSRRNRALAQLRKTLGDAHGT